MTSAEVDLALVPASATRAAARRSRGIPNVRTKSQPVPRGMIAIGVRLRREPVEPVRDLVHRPVPPDDDEQLGAACGRLAGEAAEVAGAVAEECVAVEAPPRPPGARSPASVAPSTRSPTPG